MLKLIIVDDETKVCKLIKHLIDWDAFEIDIIGVAHNGKRAFEMILNEQPDIVITDIRMPIWSGLDLIKATREEGLHTHFLITSGYSQFKYAQNALRYDVEDYLLKPLRKKDLEISIQKIIEKRNKTQAHYKKQQELESTINQQSKKIKANYLTDIMRTEDKSSNLFDISYVNTEYTCHFIPECFQVIIIKPMLPVSHAGQEAKSLLYSKVISLIKSKLEETLHEFIITGTQNGIYLLVNDSAEKIDELPKFFKMISMEVSTWQELFQDVKTYFILSSVKDSFSKLETAFREVKAQEFDYLLTDKSNIIPFHPNAAKNSIVSDILDNTLRKNLKNALEIVDTEQLNNIFATCIKHIKHHEQINGDALYKVYSTLSNWFYFNILDKHNDMDITIYLEQLKHNFSHSQNLQELFDNAHAIMLAYLKAFSETKESEGKKPIRKAKAYIHAHFNAAITLEQVSEYVGFTPAYFSTLFKKETDKNFLEYLTEIRMEHARELLKNSEYSLPEVSEMIGYHDSKYFSKLFKKMIGLSPHEFRKLYK
ncbi:MAG: response regulator [Lachnospiraceae bacterium]|nr:response regulator [Lachnospiraceae bacterium]